MLTKMPRQPPSSQTSYDSRCTLICRQWRPNQGILSKPTSCSSCTSAYNTRTRSLLFLSDRPCSPEWQTHIRSNSVRSLPASLDQQNNPTRIPGSPRPNPNAILGLRDAQAARVQFPGKSSPGAGSRQGRPRRRHRQASRVKNAAGGAERPPTTESGVPVIAATSWSQL